MLSSDTTGTPLGNRAACSFCFVPAAMSVTVLSISTPSPIDVFLTPKDFVFLN